MTLASIRYKRVILLVFCNSSLFWLFLVWTGIPNARNEFSRAQALSFLSSDWRILRSRPSRERGVSLGMATCLLFYIPVIAEKNRSFTLRLIKNWRQWFLSWLRVISLFFYSDESTSVKRERELKNLFFLLPLGSRLLIS